MTKSALYDTHRHVKRITQTGVSEDSAEAIIGSVTELIDTNIATKTDLARLETKLVRWNLGIMMAFASILIAVDKFL